MDRFKRAQSWSRGNQMALGRRMVVGGLDITIESPAGSLRHGENWIQHMAHDYGYINDTLGADGDELDVFLGPNLKSNKFYVVEQNKTDGSFDEHKIMLGFDSIEDAKAAYHANYPDSWNGFRNIQELFMSQFKEWYQNFCHANA